MHSFLIKQQQKVTSRPRGFSALQPLLKPKLRSKCLSSKNDNIVPLNLWSKTVNICRCRPTQWRENHRRQGWQVFPELDFLRRDKFKSHCVNSGILRLLLFAQLLLPRYHVLLLIRSTEDSSFSIQINTALARAWRKPKTANSTPDYNKRTTVEESTWPWSPNLSLS